MISANLPENESNRLMSLYSFDLLDTEQDDVFDELAELAADICNTPIALISLVDTTRQWFKSHLGLNASETARSASFCAHAILQPNLFIIPDTLKDKRFYDNPLVTGPPNIRFYAGAPLITDNGYSLGTLCVVDTEPRVLTARQEKTLLTLRTHVLKLFYLHRNNIELNDANKELELFGYSVSHDLRAPLRAIAGYSEIIMEDHLESLDQEAQSLFKRVINATQRMDKLTTGLLELARFSKNTLQFQSINISKLVTDVLFEYTKENPERQTKITIQPDLLVIGDISLLRIAINNLIANAWKFTVKCKTCEVEFGFKTWDDNGRQKEEYFIRDNGAGFDLAYAERIFQPFQRFHSSKDYPGTGIGLATVSRIIKRHGGEIHAQSEIGKGSTFSFTLLKGSAIN